MDILQQQDKEYIAGTYARFPLTIEGGKGSVVWDDAGKIYTDLSSGIAVNTFGIADDEWIKAITEQAGKIQHMSNLYYTEPCVKLAQMLCDRTGMKKVFFSNSGAEANECAIKAARKYAAEKHGADCYNIVTLKNSFHGRTITTLAATGQDVFHKDFLPLTEGFIYVEPNDIEKIEKVLFENRCAAVMLEVVQGEGGVMPLDKDYLQSLEKICRERDILLICDEVQIGNGRSGKLYGYMNYGIFPDIVSTAKGLAGGLPLGATLFSEKTKDVLTPGSHGSTFGGNPICCAGAINILSRLDEKTLAGVRQRSEYIFSELSGAPGIKEVSGLGLMIGIKTERDASEVINACIKKGVLVIKAKDKVRLLPALNIPMELLEQAVGVALIFEKTSTRTRCSFEVAARDLGMGTTYLDPSGSQIGKKESIADTARVLSGIYDGIEYRGFGQSIVEELAQYATVPVWNGLTNEFHPTQILADFLTIKEQFGHLKGINFVYMGDARYNMGNSLMVGCAKMGMNFTACAPKKYFPDKALIDTCMEIAAQTGAEIKFCESPDEAAKNADVIYTDVWVSMGEPVEVWEERINDLAPYQVNSELMAKASPNAVFMHCLPSYHDMKTTIGKEMGEKFGRDSMEVTDEVFESAQSVVFAEAENRMHTIKAVMAATLTDER